MVKSTEIEAVRFCPGWSALGVLIPGFSQLIKPETLFWLPNHETFSVSFWTDDILGGLLVAAVLSSKMVLQTLNGMEAA